MHTPAFPGPGEENPEEPVAWAKPGALNSSSERHELMPEGEVFKSEPGAGSEEGPQEGDDGTEEHESLPDEALGGSPAENREVSVSVVIISTGRAADGVS